MNHRVTLKVKRITRPRPDDAGACAPFYATPGSAGLDLSAALERPVTILPGERAVIPTGLAVEIPSRYLVGLMFSRSGLAARHGISLANGVGVIDSDYTGEIMCVLQNNGGEPYTIYPGDRIAQLVLVPIAVADVLFVDELGTTARGDGGFGSTGR